MEGWELAAREAIRDLVARYNVAGDAGRVDAMLRLFAADAVVEIEPGRVYRGLVEIRSLFEGAHDASRDAHPIGLLRHFVATHQIDFSERSEARGRCYFAVLTELGLDHWGHYLDRYVRLDGSWMFVARKVVVDAMAPGSWAESAQRHLNPES
jgi:hypothetical protein